MFSDNSSLGGAPKGCYWFWIDPFKFDSKTMMSAKRKPLTAGALLAELNASSTYKAAQAERDRVRLEQVRRLKEASAPLDKVLCNVCSFTIDGVWDLVNSNERYDEALPVLFEHLAKDYPDEILEGIARALAVPEAISYRPALIQRFRQDVHLSEAVRYALGIAISRTTRADNLQETIDLAKDSSLGPSRLALLFAIKRSRKPGIGQVIDELRHDPDLGKEISSWKRKK